MNVKINQGKTDVTDGKIMVDCICKQVSLCLNESQYGQIVNLAEFFRNYSKSIRVCSISLFCQIYSRFLIHLLTILPLLWSSQNSIFIIALLVRFNPSLSIIGNILSAEFVLLIGKITNLKIGTRF